MRQKLGALLGAGGLLLLAASATFAVAPTYAISVSKTAVPPTVPVSGGTVVFTVWVLNTGDGFFQTVNIVDSLGGCTLGAPVKTGGDTDDKLETGETWAYSCSVDNVTPGTTNTATVDACHDVSSCNQDAHNAEQQGSVTVLEGQATQPPGTEPPGTQPPGTEVPPTILPTGDQGGETNLATEPTTDTVGFDGGSGGVDRTLLLVLALGMLMASLILVTPARPVRQR